MNLPQTFGFQTLQEHYDICPEEPEEPTRQYIMPSCYGRGLRLQDIDVPDVPEACLHLLHSEVSIIYEYLYSRHHNNPHFSLSHR